MVDTINSDDKKKFSIGFIENTGDLPIAVQLSSKKRDIDEHGVENLKDDNDDIIIFPEQLIVPPHDKKNFKLSYTGRPSAKELYYRIVAEESSLNPDPIKLGHSGVSIKFSYHTSLYVCHEKAKPNIYIESFKRDTINKDQMLITVTNDGEKHQILNKVKITAKGATNDKILILDAEQFKFLNGLAILAGNKVIVPVNYKEISSKIGDNFTLELYFDKN
jgi:fimbrial chaperone protein